MLLMSDGRSCTGTDLPKHLLGELGCLFNAADVHATLQTAFELSQSPASCQNLALHHDLISVHTIDLQEGIKGPVIAALLLPSHDRRVATCICGAIAFVWSGEHET